MRISPLITAAKQGYLACVRKLHAAGADVRADNDAVLAAASSGELKTLKYLHEAGASIHTDDDAAMVVAAAGGHLEIVRYLHQAGASVRAHNDDAVLAAASSGGLKTLKYLHEAGGSIHTDDDAAMVAAAAGGNLEIVRYLHQAGASIHAQHDAPIIEAAATGHVEILKYLHDNGAALDAQDHSAIISAAAAGHLEVVRTLHQRGVSLRAANDSPLIAAASNAHLPIVEYLHHNGVPLHDAGLPALIRACGQGHLALVQYLHRNGVDVRHSASAALSEALVHGHEEIVRYLRDSGCTLGEIERNSPPSPRAEDYFYWNMVFPVATGQLEHVVMLHENGVLEDCIEACILAAANGQTKVLEYLHQSGNSIGKIAEKALIQAAANGRVQVMKYLHENGCDLHQHGRAAIVIAAEKCHLDALKYLHQNGVPIETCEFVAKRIGLAASHDQVIRYLADNGVLTEGPQLLQLARALVSGNASAVSDCLKGMDLARHSDALFDALTSQDNPELCALLREHGFDIRAQNDLALRKSAERGHVRLLRYLHEHGADIHALDDEALRAAATAGCRDMVAYLCSCGANVSSIDTETLDLIRINGHTEIFDFLTDRGVDAIARDRPQIQAMRDELYSAARVYHPSKLWEFFNDVNLEQLRLGGMHAFKRSINQNYFNFIPYSPLDPQLRRLTFRWLRHPTLTPLKLRLVDPDRVLETKQLVRVDLRVFTLARGFSTIAIVSKKLGVDFARGALLTLYRGLLATLWDFVRAHDKLGLVDKLSEPRLGSPLTAYLAGRMVSQDLAHSIIECNSIVGEISAQPTGHRMRIAEVGAGYGRLAFVILQSMPCQYVVIDIPPGLYVSQWYLSRLFSGKTVFTFRHFDRFEEVAAEFEKADIAFLCANQIELIPAEYFDLTINISSLHELRPDQISHMLTQIYRITNRLVYLKQYKEYVNPYDGLRIIEDSYKVAPGWKYRYYRDDPVDPRFFETLIESEGLPGRAGSSTSPAPALQLNPPRDVAGTWPTVSILLANYNHAQYLPTSLAGICGQSHPANEIIIVDDGSTDNSVEVIAEFAARFPNIRLLTNGHNRGQHYSIQRALATARSEYVVWASSDDLLLPRFLETSLDILRRHPQAGLCFSRLAVFVDGTSETREYTGETHGVAFDYGTSARCLSPTDLLAILRKHYLWMSGNTVVARRAALLEIGGFQQNLKWHADWFAFYAVALRYGACVIPERLALMRERPGTYSAGGTSDARQQERVLTAIFDTMKSQRYLDIGHIFRRCPSILSLFGKKALFAALRAPRHWDFALSITSWLGPRYLFAKYGRMRAWLSAHLHR